HTSTVRRVVRDPRRLAALRRAALLDTPSEASFDRLTELAAALLRAPIALLTLIDQERQFFKSAVGVSPELAQSRQTPLAYAFCAHTVTLRRPLAVGDLRGHPLLGDNPAIAEFGTLAYAGAPLITSEGHALGSLCVLDTQTREWSPEDIEGLENLARSAVSEIELRAAMRQAAFEQLQREQAARAAAQEAERRFAFLAQASHVLASSLDYGTTLQAVAQSAVPTIADLCVVDMVSEDDPTRVDRLAAAVADPAKEQLARWLKEQYPVDPAMPYGVPTVLRTGQPVLREEVSEELLRAVARDEKHLALLRGLDFSSTMLVPLIAQGKILGVMTFVRGASAPRYTPSDVTLAEDLAGRCALAIENARLYSAAHAAQERQRALSRQLVAVQEQERRRLARELHDELGQSLTGVRLLLESGSVAEARTLVGEAMARVRALSLQLRPAVLDDLGLLPALLWHLERYTAQTGVRVGFQHSGVDRRFPLEIETAAYRVAQESLTNVARHAGVPEASLRVWATAEALCVQVEDSGAGFRPERVGHATSGVSGMRERVELLDGSLVVDSAPGEGTRVAAVLPLAAKMSAAEG
ncbi:MAG TPA: GAF domain-containing protein, partial [Chloroflexota bacterium]|nr:GAF domain-containing protein [Chloroflexota bacterium]